VRPILVTGVTGFIGWHVAEQLLRKGEKVRALVRPSSKPSALDVETVTGDLGDPSSLEMAVAGCETVYHVAADYRLWAPDASELYRTNVDGTHNLLEAARRAGVGCFVYTSTVGCIGIPNNGLGDESTPVSLEAMKGPYKRSKFLAERVAFDYARTGFPVKIVNPTAPVGDHDVKPTPTGRILLDFLKRRLPAYVDTGLNLVDVRDAARGHLLAAQKGAPGERYILGCQNLTLREIFQRLAVISGLAAPGLRIPYAAAYAAGVVSTALAHLTGKEPLAPLDGVRMARKKMFVSYEKARRELGYEPGPVDSALERAVRWFRDNGYC